MGDGGDWRGRGSSLPVSWEGVFFGGLFWDGIWDGICGLTWRDRGGGMGLKGMRTALKKG